MSSNFCRGIMKKIAFTLSLMLGILVVALFLNTQTASSKTESINLKGSKVVVYYLHNNFRCPNCYKIENYTKEAVNQNFSKELKDGKLVFKVINFDENPNKHYVEDYQLYTKSVVLSKTKDGKQVQWKNLDKIWTLLGDKKKFQEYIKTETTNFLKGSK